MGRVVQVKYRLECWGNAVFSPSAWHGWPTPERLAKYMNDLNQSFVSGVNRPRDPKAVIPYASRAKVIDQQRDTVVCEWRAPMFQVM